ncbi:MAG: GMP synthase [Methanoregula sp. PtaU1.Bin051]|nr:MAG: GMP synthase [Methanoregula sp. PtaU1.Bin051]
MELSDRKALLKKIIADKGSMLVAFSGGVDSGLLAYLARNLLKEKCRCVLLDSPVMPRDEIRQAEEIAKNLGLALEIIPAPLMESAHFRGNLKERCYHCKKILSGILKKRAEELALSCVADGLNVTDTGEYRPGIRASDEEGILHPFIEAGITKEEIRAIARENRLPFWDKPSAACLSSRIPYGEEITEKKLLMIEKAEGYLHRLGIRQLRVRLHGKMARIEADDEGMATIFANKGEVVKVFEEIGFSSVTLDLAGYRRGSMDETI